MSREKAREMLAQYDEPVLNAGVNVALENSGLMKILREWSCEFGNAVDSDFSREVTEFIAAIKQCS